MKQLTLPLLIMVLASTSAWADDIARYSMRAVPEGTLRLDTRTGATTLCTTDSGRLRCAISAEEREAYAAEIDALGTRLEELEKRLAALEPARSETEPTAAEAPSQGKRNIDKALSLADRALRGFAGTVRRMRDDLMDG